MSSIYDNRKGLLVPVRPDYVSIGNEFTPLKDIYSKDGNFNGVLNVEELYISGEKITKEKLGVGDETSNGETKIKYVKSSNIEVENDIEFGGNIKGKGDELDLTHLKSSIVPGAPELYIGEPSNPYKQCYFENGDFQDCLIQNCTIKNSCTANEFYGNGQGLCNVPPYLLNVKSSILNDGNEKYDIGSKVKPFGDIFCDSIDMKNYIKGRRLLITNENYPFNIEKKSTITAPKVNKEGIVTEELKNALGDYIDIQTNTTVFGTSYIVDLTSKNLTIQNDIKFMSNVTMGTEDEPLYKLYCYDAEFIRSYSTQGNVNVGNNLTVDKNADIHGSIFCDGQIHGNGKYIYGVNHLAPIVSNIVPQYDNEVKLGDEDFYWKECRATDIYAINIDTEVLNADELYIDGRSVKYNDWLVLQPKEKHYSNIGRMVFNPIEENTTTFAIDIEPSEGTFRFSKSGLYSINMFGLETSFSKLDNNVNWQIDHYYSRVGRSVAKNSVGLSDIMIYVSKDDRLSFNIRPITNQGVTIKENDYGGVIITLLTCTSA